MTFSEKFIKKFWSNVKIGGPNDCWEWQKCCAGIGYGHVRFKYKQLGTHRVAWTLINGDPGDLWVLHRCDNPKCCNPNHLFLGTHQDNVTDMVNKGRNHLPPAFSGEDHSQAKLSENEIVEIINSAEPQKVLAKKYGVTQGHISNIKHKRTWKHV